MTRPFYAVTTQDLERLDPKGAVEAFASLLRAEAAADGIAKNLIDVPQAINVRDGGIDAEIRAR